VNRGGMSLGSATAVVAMNDLGGLAPFVENTSQGPAMTAEQSLCPGQKPARATQGFTSINAEGAT